MSVRNVAREKVTQESQCLDRIVDLDEENVHEKDEWPGSNEQLSSSSRSTKLCRSRIRDQGLGNETTVRFASAQWQKFIL